MTQTQEQRDLLECVAAVSADFHADARFAEWYERNAQTYDGCSGIWRMVSEAGHIYHEQELHHTRTTGRKHEFIAGIEQYVHAMYEMDAPFAASELAEAAQIAIEANS
jgi:hypothetical protein